jgi:uncharacterized membrane protein YccF (DUF307 family)
MRKLFARIPVGIALLLLLSVSFLSLGKESVSAEERHPEEIDQDRSGGSRRGN